MERDRPGMVEARPPPRASMARISARRRPSDELERLLGVRCSG